MDNVQCVIIDNEFSLRENENIIHCTLSIIHYPL